MTALTLPAGTGGALGGTIARLLFTLIRLPYIF